MADRYASLKQGLVGAWIPSISGSGLLLPDLSGRGNNGVLTNMDASDWVSSQYGKALDFDGVNDVAVAAPIGTSYAQMSAFCWVRVPATIGSDAQVFSQYNTTDNQRAWQIGVRSTGTALQVIISADGTSSAVKVYESVVNVFDSSWRNVGFVFSNNSLRLFANGIELSVTAIVDNVVNAIANLNAKVAIGGRQAGAGYTTFGNAQIDDARIYNRALTEPEIRLLASEPGIGFKPAKKLSRFSQRFTYKPPKAKVFEGVRVRDHDYASLREGLVGAWCPSLPNGGSGNTLPDQSGRGNHGTLTNMDASDWVSSQYGRALDFDGTDDYISIAHSSFINASNAFSLSCWITTGADITTEQHVITKSFLSPSLNIGYRLYIQTSTFAWYLSPDGGAAPNRAFRSSTAIAANTLYHVVGTFLGSTLLDVYLNGRLANSGLTGTIPASVFATSAPLLFGAQGNTITTATGFFAGRLDDVRLYNRVLSQSEIRLLASRRGIGLQPSRTHLIAKEKKTGLRRKILTGQT